MLNSFLVDEETDRNAGGFLSITPKQLGIMISNYAFTHVKLLKSYFSF